MSGGREKCEVITVQKLRANYSNNGNMFPTTVGSRALGPCLTSPRTIGEAARGDWQKKKEGLLRNRN